MTPAEIRAARESLGLSRPQMAAMLDLKSPQDVQRMEMPVDAATHRAPPVRVTRLLRLYLAGARPDDWPARRRPAARAE